VRCCGCAAAALVAVVLVVVGAAAFTGFVPGLSSLAGTDKPRDLNVRWTQQDYTNFYAKAQVEVQQPDYLCLDCRVEYSGRQPVDASFSQSEITALLAVQNQKFGPLRDIQIKFNQDKSLEFSAMSVREMKLPLYFKGIPLRSGGKLDFNLQSVEAGRLPLPGSMIAQYTGTQDSQDSMREIIDALMKQAGILQLDDMRVDAGFFYFKGVLPKIVKGIGPPSGVGGGSR
jgi:hypothetical protein